MSDVRVLGLVKTYGTARALDDVTLDFPDGQFFGLLGPSGSGKTTLLRAIAGFVTPDQGRIRIDGQPVERVRVEAREIDSESVFFCSAIGHPRWPRSICNH